MLLFIVNYLFFFWSTWLISFSRIIKHTSYEWGIFCMKYFRAKIDIRGDNKQNELFINNGDLTFTEKAKDFIWFNELDKYFD